MTNQRFGRPGVQIHERGMYGALPSPIAQGISDTHQLLCDHAVQGVRIEEYLGIYPFFEYVSKIVGKTIVRDVGKYQVIHEVVSSPSFLC
jgi:hypothetical protein